MTLITTLLVLSIVLASASQPEVSEPSFKIKNDRFVLDGSDSQIISGSIHYFRVPRPYWEDRLTRLKALGLNTVQIYVPWNKHEPSVGRYDFDDKLDVTAFVDLAQRVGLWVILRAGPYICAEWDGGGLPWWLASSKVAGGGSMRLRSDDPKWLSHVDRWWSVLLPKLAPYARSRGGPILMVQVENEYGFCGDSKPYLRNLIALARKAMRDVVIFTTDPPSIVKKGSIAGDEVFTVVDFGPQMNATEAFAVQKQMNPPGSSPPFCSEYYTGWLTHWGQGMANTSAQEMTDSFTAILQYSGGSGSVNLYMAHGGTNFGFYAGAGLSGKDFLPQITSYDYGAPLSEQGRTGQPGIGGPNKYEMLRAAISQHTGKEKPEWPEDLPTAAYGRVHFNTSVRLLDVVSRLFPGDGIASQQPKNMEEYDQGHGMVLYTTEISGGKLAGGATLDFGGPVHDYAHVYLGGALVDTLSRSHPHTVALPASQDASSVKLEVLVHAMGRDSGGCAFDIKGLVSPVALDGRPLDGWRTFLLPLDNLDTLGSDLGSKPGKDGKSPSRSSDPTILRGEFVIDSSMALGATGHLPDTFLNLTAWGKGVAFVNGFNLGWYWPSIGPQNHYFVPGPLLRRGSNEVLLVEVEELPEELEASLVEEPDLRGPGSSNGADAVSTS